MNTDIKNLKGEKGGEFIDGSWTASSVKETLLGFIVVEEATIVSISMPNFGGTESKLVGSVLPVGATILGAITAIEVSGLIQGVYH